MASRPTVLGLGRKIILGSILFSVGLMVFSESRVLWMELIALPITGFGLMIQMASCNTILQTIVEDRMRGRVMSLFTLAFMGLSPLGILLAGGMSRLIGTPLTLLVGGAVCLLAGLYFALRLERLRQLVRPIYAERGILPRT
jgi:MFS family permease